ncbi:MAG: ABC transporter ATP-binding protein [Armatimonadota bacterium]|nr:ABC transporter ATP-binding protein [Armatimonadota bacterium]MDR7469329.1 ABC transporter ATP-binding protein [Armatimonadota bacterium]MDR7539243.1 ABC transporter ATP-binding protein [Armatimonadota bacterium]
MTQAVAGEPAVEARGLTKRFGEFVAVDHIDLTIARGEVFGFLGPNGAGKTTTIRMLCGLLPPTAGTAYVLGVDVRRDPEAVKARVGYMGQRASMYDDLSVGELLHFYGRIYGLPPRERARKVRAWLEEAGLAGRERQLVGTLPSGWRQRVALGCAVLHRPELLLLDEPTSGIDPLQRRGFWELIYRFADEGTTVLVTTHYMDEAEHCTTLAFIHGGRIVAQGSPAWIKHTAIRGGLLEVLADPWAEALAVLGDLPVVRDAALHGVAIRALVDDPHGAVPQVADALRTRGVLVRRIAPRGPSLEEVFISLVEPAETPAAAQSPPATTPNRGPSGG